jgi:S1-C subfamily serine protease
VPAAGRLERLGITVEPVTADFAREQALDAADAGVRVTDVARTGPARTALSLGTDVITDVLYPARRKVRTPADLQQALAALKPGDVISLRVYSTAEPIGARVANVRLAE